jgi:hypothetical protein
MYIYRKNSLYRFYIFIKGKYVQTKEFIKLTRVARAPLIASLIVASLIVASLIVASLIVASLIVY